MEFAGFLIVSTGISIFPFAYGTYPWVPVLLIGVGGAFVFAQRRIRRSREQELDQMRLQGRDADAINFPAVRLLDD